jgi:hypothetical protein
MHGGIDGGGTVVRAVPGERSHRTLDLIEQRRDFGVVVTVAVRHDRWPDQRTGPPLPRRPHPCDKLRPELDPVNST